VLIYIAAVRLDLLDNSTRICDYIAAEPCGKRRFAEDQQQEQLVFLFFKTATDVEELEPAVPSLALP
jgi:hypothetical protein